MIDIDIALKGLTRLQMNKSLENHCLKWLSIFAMILNDPCIPFGSRNINALLFLLYVFVYPNYVNSWLTWQIFSIKCYGKAIENGWVAQITHPRSCSNRLLRTCNQYMYPMLCPLLYDKGSSHVTACKIQIIIYGLQEATACKIQIIIYGLQEADTTPVVKPIASEVSGLVIVSILTGTPMQCTEHLSEKE